jgi:hypothetical protein
MNGGDDASTLQLLGPFGFGAILGWFLYFTEPISKGGRARRRRDACAGVIGGPAIVALLPAKTDLFGAYRD